MKVSNSIRPRPKHGSWETQQVKGRPGRPHRTKSSSSQEIERYVSYFPWAGMPNMGNTAGHGHTLYYANEADWIRMERSALIGHPHGGCTPLVVHVTSV